MVTLLESYLSKDNAGKYLDKLTPEEIKELPDKFLCVLPRPIGFSYGEPEFKVVNKSAFLSNPDECFAVWHWGYAHANQIRIATRDDLIAYKNQKVKDIESSVDDYMKWCIQ